MTRQEEREEMGAPGSGERRLLSKLKLFRLSVGGESLHLLTRISVYLFATMLDFKHLWLQYFVSVMTLAFA
jgi:hypothetical protein